MMSQPIVVNDSRSTADDACLRRLIEFLGLSCRTVEASAFDTELDRVADHGLCVLASAATIDGCCHNRPNPASAFDKLRRKASSLFVYGFAPETPTYIAASLSNGSIADVRAFAPAGLRYKVSSFHPEITREFSGLSFAGVHNATDFGFVCSPNVRGMVPLVTIGGMPFWVLVENNGYKAFLLACSAIADIQEQVNGNIDATEYFSRLVPAAMFLRSVFKSQCWHSKRRFANFIIDDPPLKRSYGYLNYSDLASTTGKRLFASTIAFIPWNYRRTDQEVTQLFREHPDRLSLCVHGCDHTTAEFSSTDLAVLNSRVQLASARMDSLNRQEGLLYSKAMVFPQGRFSTEALKALKSNNYLAAVNSSASPVYSLPNRSLTVADFLEPAVTKYGFPLFSRRYPAGLEQFAFDLFFGKPVLVVEHHAYLKDGGGRLAAFIAGLNSLARLQWSGLHEIITRSYVEREISDDIAACTLYANDHVIENHVDRERTFMVSKSEVDDVPIQNVLVNGHAADFVARGDALRFTMRIPAFSSTRVKIVYRNVLPGLKPGRTVASRSRVWTRRMLSEFRDNIFCRNDFWLAGAQALHRRLSKLCWRLLVGRVPEWNQLSEFDCPATAYDWEKSEGCDRLFRAAAEVHGQVAASIAPTRRRADIVGKKYPSASEVARGVLGPNSTATINNVLVLGTEGSTPLKRMEIHLRDPKEVPATLNLLAAALQSSGVDFRAVRNPGIPATEIWLTSPLHDGKKTLLCCAAMVSEQAAQPGVVQAGSPRKHTP